MAVRVRRQNGSFKVKFPGALQPRGFLFLCAANSARSQIGEGLARKLAPTTVKVQFAGSRPTSVRPEAVAVLSELGIDAS